MTGTNRVTILIVDERQEKQSTLADSLSREATFEVHLANDWRESLSLPHEVAPDVIICDGSIAWDEILQFCDGLRHHPALSRTIFIVLGPPYGIEEKNRGLEAGIDDWIEKSVPSSLIIGKIKAWIRTRALEKESRKRCEALEEKSQVFQTNVRELTAILVKILDSRLSGASDRASTAKSIAEYITEQLNIAGEERQNILFASLLHEMGKVGLPQSIAEKNYHSLRVEERAVFGHYPVIGSMIISGLTGYKDAASAIHHQLENYDGSGVPDGLMGDEIPAGARIIRAIVFQEELYRAGFSTEGVIAQIKVSLNRLLDPSIAGRLIGFLEKRDRSILADKLRLTLDELKTGMKLAEDVYSAGGIKLLPKGVVLRERMIAILSERNAADPIIGGIYVFKN